MNCYIALIHYPVYNKHADIVTTSVTTLDVHDISRIAKTFGVKKFFLVTPLLAHKELVNRMIEHWREGFGATYNPTRKEALSLLELVDKIEDVRKIVEEENGLKPVVVTTCAKNKRSIVTFPEMKRKIFSEESPFLILFGTGWGLAENIIKESNYTLEPIKGVGEFNHLPVRAAVAITLDRLISP